MKEQLVTPLIGIIVTSLLSVWKTPGIREGVFSWIGKLPRTMQWLAPLLLAMLTTAGEGFLGGKTGQDLFYYAMGSGAEAGAFAIATWHVVKRLIELVKSKPVAPALILLGALAAGGTQVGCGRAAVDVQLDKIEDYGVQVQGYVDYLESVFQVAVNAPGLDPAKKQELLQKFVDGREQFNAAFDAFVAGLRAAREANAETVDINALVGTLVTAVTKIIDVIELVGANPLWIQDQRSHAMSLSRGI